MSKQHKIRAANPEDAAAIKATAVESGLFEADEVESFDEMLNGFFDGSLEDHSWLVLEDDSHSIDANNIDSQNVIGAAYYAPEPFSDRIWNLYFIAIRPRYQGGGTGGALITHVERALRDRGEDIARILIVETSGLEGFELTRQFYRKHGFDEEARIREFYGPGDDKVVFWKSLV